MSRGDRGTERADIAILLLDHGAAACARDNAGDTALHCAARSGSVDAAIAVCSKLRPAKRPGSQNYLHITNHKGELPLELAVKSAKAMEITSAVCVPPHPSRCYASSLTHCSLIFLCNMPMVICTYDALLVIPCIQSSSQREQSRSSCGVRVYTLGQFVSRAPLAGPNSWKKYLCAPDSKLVSIHTMSHFLRLK